MSDSNDKVVRLLSSIRDLLKDQNALLQKALVPPEDSEEGIASLILHESRGSCPQCEAPEVSIGKAPGDIGPVYQCKACETVWVNDPILYEKLVELYCKQDPPNA